MKFSKLRILGFKSFVEPIEFVIDTGLTGVVGPNGCGKSNLVEALRWVMGENSYKNMRAAEMDEVIFSGSRNRPSRNSAEVTVFLDNEIRSAPPAFNNSDDLEITRRIEREAGSNYRINGRSVRARDVQLLFADASTGARSPALVRQGQISELIAAKPTARRQILEEAAGISGLHARRHDAELRLNGAETNLGRVNDLLNELEGQLETLNRQARQAVRYRSLSSRVRRAEALVALSRWKDAQQALENARLQLKETAQELASAGTRQAAAARDQAIADANLPGLRQKEAESASAFQRLSIAQAELDAEVDRTRARTQEIETLLNQLAEDLARERRLEEENRTDRKRLDDEEREIKEQTEHSSMDREKLEARCKELNQILQNAEEALSALKTEAAAFQAEKAQSQRVADELVQQVTKLSSELEKTEHSLAQMSAQDQISEKDTAEKELEAAQLQLNQAIKNAEISETALLSAQQKVEAAKIPLADAEADFHRAKTEADTLGRVLRIDASALWSPILEKMQVVSGFETALGVALGDDLEASDDQGASSYWSVPGNDEHDAQLPKNVEPLSKFVIGPELTRRRLNQIGLVAAEDGAKLQKFLLPGQRLVSKDGGLWRWDGFRIIPGTVTAAAERLEQRNRHSELVETVDELAITVAELKAALDDLEEDRGHAQDGDQEARRQWQNAQTHLSAEQEKLANINRKKQSEETRRAGLQGAQGRVSASLVDAKRALDEHEGRMVELSDTIDEDIIEQAEKSVAAARSDFNQANVALESFSREAFLRQSRLEAIIREQQSWSARIEASGEQIARLSERQDKATEELNTLSSLPGTYTQRRQRILTELSKAEAKRQTASDNLVEGEKIAAAAQAAAHTMLEQLSACREAEARADERVQSNAEKLSDLNTQIIDQLGTMPDQLAETVGLKDPAELEDRDGLERTLERLRLERERMGAVNLLAEKEAVELKERIDELTKERDDLTKAIGRLRSGIASLNNEARQRLLEAFKTVNEHFQSLFVTLFGGGAAELKLVDSDDLLDAGLQILARPPGKRQQTITLLSGGEQALTATALIFAVFLTNPSPICVLDEVDAPLDDANVERFCDLLTEMSTKTQTRFIIVTHNPITMARVDRLFGVTMREKGVSQLVSVDFQTASQYLEAG